MQQYFVDQELSEGQIIALEYLGQFEEAKRLATEYLTDYPQDHQMLREVVFLTTR